METPWPENLCAHRIGTIEKLIKDRARDTAAQLQILSENPTGDDDGPEELLVELLNSFTRSLSHISLCTCEDCECEVAQIPNRVGSPISDQRSENSGEGCKRPAAEDRSGCYKRRKISEMSMEVLSTTNEDGHAWRKYGQTKIPEAQFPIFSSKTFSSDSESHSRSFSSIAISTQYTSSCPYSAASVRKECWGESGEIALSNSLRFLSLQGCSQIKELPFSASELPNLEVLVLKGCSKLVKLPDRIDLFKKLRYLDLSSCYSLGHMTSEEYPIS